MLYQDVIYITETVFKPQGLAQVIRILKSESLAMDLKHKSKV